MMTSVTYKDLALDWSPDSRLDHAFNIIAVLVLVCMLTVGIIFSSVNLPEEERVARTVVPERIAQFVLEQEKPKPEPKPEPPKPKPKPKPKIERQPKKPLEKTKALTKQEKQARKKAENTGLLALGNELADLMDTSDISAMVGGKVSRSLSASTQAASNDKSLLTQGAGAGSGGVEAGEFTRSVSKTKLTRRELAQVKQSLLSRDAQSKAAAREGRSGNVRAEEDVTIVFDQNKSKLYSIYNRARRTNPGLKGKIVLEISIAPSGKVTKVRIVSSELGDPKLERSLVARVKQFNFGAKSVEAVTVTYPIEFLPS